jgi:hypothetical protein
VEVDINVYRADAGDLRLKKSGILINRVLNISVGDINRRNAENYNITRGGQ